MSETLDFQKIVGEVAAAYFGNSHVSVSEIGAVIQQIATSLSAVGAPALEESAVEEAGEAEAQQKMTPAQIRRSITPDALISFEDGKQYKTLRRHLAVKGLSPEQYREKWGLPKTYPMVAPSYSEARAALARSIGLGSRVNRNTEAASAPLAAAAAAAPELTAPEPESKEAPEPAAAKRTRGPGRKNAAEAAPAPRARKARAAKAT